MIKECENCGQLHDKPFVIIKDGREHTFDSFECAIDFIAPRCFHCNKLVIGREIYQDGEIFCSPDCSNETHFSTVVP
jgi:hypothetical protein